MKREIFLKATAEKKQLPKQWGGMQYEDNATEIVFDITDIVKENILWRIDFDSATAGYDPSETLIAEGRNGGLCVARFIPYTMTRHGGEIQVTLVGTEIDEQGEAVAIAYTVPFFAFFTDVEQHEESEDKAAINISAAEKSALDSAQRAEDSAEEAQQSAEAAEIAQQKTKESMMALEAGSTIIFQGGNASSRFTVDIAVDDELSKASENPVQNRMVFERFEEQDKTDAKFDANLSTAQQDIKTNEENHTKLEKRVTAAEEKNRELAERVYMVEYGTSEDGIWTYIKWSNGFAECWGSMTQNFSIKKLWGDSDNMYISLGQYIVAVFPFEFNEPPHCIYSVDSNNLSVLSIPHASSHATTTQSFPIQFARPNAVDSVDITVYWYIRGVLKKEAE